MDEEHLRSDFRTAESSLLKALREPPDIIVSSPKVRDYRAVSRACNPQHEALETKIVKVRHLEFGGSRPVIIAGPCAVESYHQTMEVARAVCSAGADMLRGGAFKPRTSPYDFQGLGEEGLKILAAVREATCLPVIVDPSHATGDADMVPMAAEAAIAYGAHGLIIEVMGTEGRREELRCDGQQTIRPAALRQVISRVRRSMDGSNPEVVRQA